MTSRRFIFVAVVAVLLIAAIAAGNGSAHTTAPSAPVQLTTGTSRVLFCPGLPAELQHEAGRVTLANVGDAPADVLVTSLGDDGRSSHKRLTLAARSTVTSARNAFGGPGALTIETFGGNVVAEEGVEGPAALESAPCASAASSHWYFAAGSTLRGVQQWLVIDNPFASNARVDVTLRTSSGVHKPDRLQDLDIARRSRYVVALDTILVREARVAVEIDTQVGSVVAAQAIVYTKDASPPGVAFTLGAPAASDHWTFSGTVATPGVPAALALTDVGADDAQLSLQVVVDGQPAIPVQPVTLQADDVKWFQLGHCRAGSADTCVAIPHDAPFSLVVMSAQKVPVVAQILDQFDGTGGLFGATTSLGAFEPSTTSVFARMQLGAQRSTLLSIYNSLSTGARVDVTLVHGGHSDRPAGMQQIAVAPGRRVNVTVIGTRAAFAGDAAIVVHSTQPVFVERTITGTDEIARSVAIPVG